MKYIDDTLENKTVLITGGAGFIGSNLAFYFQNNHPKARVVVFDLFKTAQSFGHFKNLIGFKGDIICGDITKKEDLERLDDYKIDYIFHEAAISDTTVLNQELMIRTNVNAFADLLKIAAKNNARMIYASSGATYGDALSPQTIGVENPQNVYGFSKLTMDMMNFNRNFEKPTVGLRYFNVYGEREFFKEKTASMVLQLGLQMLGGKAPRLFHGSDKIVRDFIYIEDVIQANILAMKADKSGVYNVGTANARSFLDIANILQKELKTNFKTEFFPNPYRAYQTHTEANIQSTIKELGFKPRYSLEQGIKAYTDEIKRIYETEVKPLQDTK